MSKIRLKPGMHGSNFLLIPLLFWTTATAQGGPENTSAGPSISDKLPVDQVIVPSAPRPRGPVFRVTSTADLPRLPALESGSLLDVQLTSKVKWDRITEGDPFEGKLVQPLYAGDRILVPKGSKVKGQVVAVKRGKGYNGAPVIWMELTDLRYGNDWHAVTTNSLAVPLRLERSPAFRVNSVNRACGVGPGLLGPLFGDDGLTSALSSERIAGPDKDKIYSYRLKQELAFNR